MASLRSRLRDPTTWTSISQLLKTAVAAVVAWLLSADVFHVSQPFLAPWAALLTVHATIFGSLRRGAAQAAATVVGVLCAFGAGHLFGVSALSIGVAVLIGLIAGSLRGLRAEATTAAATAIVVLTTGYSDNGMMLGARLLDTSMGIAVGLLVNLIVWPPLRDRSAAQQVNLVAHRAGSLLADIAAQIGGEWRAELPEGWLVRSDGLDNDIDHAWSILEQARESGRLNPRPVVPQRMRDAEGFGAILGHLAQAIAEIRSLARTIGLAQRPPARWPADFRDPWRELVGRAGIAVRTGDAAAVGEVRSHLERLANELDLALLPKGFWPISGALIVNLRNILQALETVAAATPVHISSRARSSPRGASTPPIPRLQSAAGPHHSAPAEPAPLPGHRGRGRPTNPPGPAGLDL
jgi:F0F1-type ATP synthase assembly protein I